MISITTESAKFSILGMFHIGPGMVLDFYFFSTFPIPSNTEHIDAMGTGAYIISNSKVICM